MHQRSTCLLMTGAALCLLSAAPAGASPRVIALTPPAASLEFTIYAMSLFPMSGHYERFTGALRVDPAHPETCTVTLDVDIASLVMANPDRTRLALSPKLLDQAAYPHLLYQGGCAGGHASGMLTMHGVTKPLALTATRDGQEVTAIGILRRTDFGVTGLPGLVGNRITVAFTMRLPPDLAGLIIP